jgi:hypothetical protein
MILIRSTIFSPNAGRPLRRSGTPRAVPGFWRAVLALLLLAAMPGAALAASSGAVVAVGDVVSSPFAMASIDDDVPLMGLAAGAVVLAVALGVVLRRSTIHRRPASPALDARLPDGLAVPDMEQRLAEAIDASRHRRARPAARTAAAPAWVRRLGAGDDHLEHEGDVDAGWIATAGPDADPPRR